MEDLIKETPQGAEESVEAVPAVEEAKEEVAETAAEAVETVADTAVEAVADNTAAEAVAESDGKADAEKPAGVEAGVEAAAGQSEEGEKDAEAVTESMEDYAQELEATFRKINTGDVLTGTVIGVSDTQITLDLGYYTDGIINFEEASDDPSFSLKDRISIGQKLSAKVLRKDDGAGHILLSMKEAAELMAWDRLRELKETQADISVRISGVTKGGAITTLEGVRGFIPASKLSLSYVEENDLPSWIGKSIDVRVLDADQATRHLVLSARDILWEKKQAERKQRIADVEVGTVTEGTVETIKPYGAFINLGDGLSGLLHVSQISQKRIKNPGEVLKEGQTVKVKVTANKDGKLSLSMKALEENYTPEPAAEEHYDLPKSEKLGTSLGDLLAGLKF